MRDGQTVFSCHDEVVALENVHFAYGKTKVIDGLDFTVRQRDFVGLVGANGTGKTTLLRMIAGLLKPDEGEIRLFGEPVSRFKDWKRIGYVPQKHNLNPLFPATVREMVQSGLYGNHKMLRWITRHDRKKCEDAMMALGIENLAERRIGRLSGGQQQRVFLARALVNNPDLLILDEPMGGIDAETQSRFFRMVRHMHEHHDITFLMVTHDVGMIYDYLGREPVSASGKLQFYVKHSHELQDCDESDLTHSLRDFHRRELERGELLQ